MDTNWSELFSIIPSSLISLLVLFLVTKMIGKKQVSELSLFDYVIGISIGNFTAEMTMNLEEQYLNGIVAIVVFGITSFLVSKITMKSIILRRLIIGTPTILIQNGKIIEKNLKKVMIDISDLQEQCRNNGIFDLSEIEYAIMEANGKISILPKSENKPLTPKDMKIKVSKEDLCANVVIDSKIMIKNLEKMHKDEKWLLKELKIKGYKNLDNILLATLDINEKINIYEKNYGIKVHNVLEWIFYKKLSSFFFNCFFDLFIIFFLYDLLKMQAIIIIDIAI